MGFADADLTDDGFLGGRVRLWQPRTGFRASTDAVLLAAAVPAQTGQAVLDLGCGAGTAVLCLGARVAGLTLAGLELQPDYADLARRNALRNDIALSVHEGDVAALPAALRALSFDHVMLNPPFYPAGGGTDSADPGRARALREDLPLVTWIETALRRLRPGGHLTIILAAERLADALAGIGPAAGGVAILPLAARSGRAAKRVVIRARKGSRAALRILPPFILHEGAGHGADADDFTDKAARILRSGGALPL